MSSLSTFEGHTSWPHPHSQVLSFLITSLPLITSHSLLNLLCYPPPNPSLSTSLHPPVTPLYTIAYLLQPFFHLQQPSHRLINLILLSISIIFMVPIVLFIVIILILWRFSSITVSDPLTLSQFKAPQEVIPVSSVSSFVSIWSKFDNVSECIQYTDHWFLLKIS